MHARVECVKVAKLFLSKEESMYVLTTYIYMYAYVNIDIRKGRTKNTKLKMYTFVSFSPNKIVGRRWKKDLRYDKKGGG